MRDALLTLLCTPPLAAGEGEEESEDGVTWEHGWTTFDWYEGEPDFRKKPETDGANFTSEPEFVAVGRMRALVLRNRWLEVTGVPEAGCAIAQATYLPSDTCLFPRP